MIYQSSQGWSSVLYTLPPCPCAKWNPLPLRPGPPPVHWVLLLPPSQHGHCFYNSVLSCMYHVFLLYWIILISIETSCFFSYCKRKNVTTLSLPLTAPYLSPPWKNCQYPPSPILLLSSFQHDFHSLLAADLAFIWVNSHLWVVKSTWRFLAFTFLTY